MRARLAVAAATAAATATGAAWLIAYDPWRSYKYVDYSGDHHRWTVPTKENPWWSSYLAFALILLGAAVVVWLLPEARRLIRRDARQVRRAVAAHVQSLVRRAVTR